MQDIKIVSANELNKHPYLVKSIADALERAIKSRLGAGEYVVVNGMIRKATKSE